MARASWTALHAGLRANCRGSADARDKHGRGMTEKGSIRTQGAARQVGSRLVPDVPEPETPAGTMAAVLLLDGSHASSETEAERGASGGSLAIPRAGDDLAAVTFQIVSEREPMSRKSPEYDHLRKIESAQRRGSEAAEDRRSARDRSFPLWSARAGARSEAYPGPYRSTVTPPRGEEGSVHVRHQGSETIRPRGSDTTGFDRVGGTFLPRPRQRCAAVPWRSHSERSPRAVP
jgi:hypothetical protein